jgi:GntR family transcriptional regulator
MSDQVRDVRRPGHFWADNELADDYLPGIGLHAFAVYMLLCRYADASGRCFPAIPTLAKQLGISKPTVLKAIATLKTAKLVAVEPRAVNGKTTTNEYQLLSIDKDDTRGKPALPLPIEGVKEIDPRGKPALPPGVKDVDPKNTYKEEDSQKKTLSRVAEAPRETPPEPAPSPAPKDDPVKRDDTQDKINAALSDLPESPPEPETRYQHPPGHYAIVDGVMTGPFNNYSAAQRFAPTGRITQTPPADMPAVAPANPGRKGKPDATPGEAPKRDPLFVAVARYLSLPEETAVAPYPKSRCKRVNQVKGYVLDVAGRPDKPDYAALAAKLDGFAAWCKGQGFSAPKEEVKFTGRFNEYYTSANGNGNGNALPREDFAEKWYSSRMAWYKREGGQLYRKPIGSNVEWRKAGEND